MSSFAILSTTHCGLAALAILQALLLQPPPPPPTEPTPVTAKILPTIIATTGDQNVDEWNALLKEGGTIVIPASFGTSTVIRNKMLDLRPRLTWVRSPVFDAQGRPVLGPTGQQETRIEPRYHPLRVTIRGEGRNSILWLDGDAWINCVGSHVDVENVRIHGNNAKGGLVYGRETRHITDATNPNQLTPSVNGVRIESLYVTGSFRNPPIVAYGVEHLTIGAEVEINGTVPAVALDPARLEAFGFSTAYYGYTNSKISLDGSMLSVRGGGPGCSVIEIGGHTTDVTWRDGWACCTGQHDQLVKLIGYPRAFSRDNIPMTIYLDIAPECNPLPGYWEQPDGAQVAANSAGTLRRECSVRAYGRSRIGEVTFSDRYPWIRKYAR